MASRLEEWRETMNRAQVMSVRDRRAIIGIAAMVVAALAAALVLAATVGSRGAEAAFPGDNGKIVFSSSRDRNAQDIFAIDPTGGTPVRLTTFTTGHNIDPAVSPDGSRIAFSRGTQIWVMPASGMNSDGTGATQITTTATTKTKPTWSPDGSRIAYVANSFDVDQQTDLEIWAINADGSGPTQLTNNTVSDHEPAWSPGGSQIAFVKAQDIYVMNSDGSGTAINLTPTSPLGCSPNCYGGIDSSPSWSPDGNQIAYMNYGESGNSDVFKMDTDPATSDWTNLTANQGEDTDPAWSPNGTRIVYQWTSNDPLTSTDRNIYTMDANGANPAPLDTNTAHDISPDWQPIPQCTNTNATSGDDTITGDPAKKEVICGAGGNDTITGQDGDILMGDAGNDKLVVPTGRATLNGGADNDTVSFENAGKVSASLTSGFAQRVGTSPLEGVALVGVENLSGSPLADMLTGSDVANKLLGFGGKDKINSRDGAKNDTVNGGSGTDKCATDRKEVSIKSC